ncbi:MAG: NADH dehydrogenase transmembrane subunit [Candidatus Atelocyanobacterium thalassa isolate SIO64986]|uniref:NAD(P)H-quinone oxidoreductase subunit L n=1 Tax=Candidatus Atelocyanobacterium thalassa isolate SIO64986 TaxID=1527444 RepID=A0A086CHE0_9CHRO|nr:MAG: NADH dehydrogenase transmembrane subunit [Candidatus Atelocyanobacterium thalassa isolate SIO64986]
MNIANIISAFSWDTLLAALTYLTLSISYLLIVPGLIYIYLKSRWYVASSIERTLMYSLMFFFFPGVLLLSPFLNFRPKRRQLNV